MNKPIHYYWSGKFVGKDKTWKHMERTLTDYELIVMEKGTLFIEDEWRKYEVKEGEYLIMEPTKCQKGYRASKCSFYWMHFTLSESGQNDSENVPFMESGDEQNHPSDIFQGIIARQGKLLSDERLYILMKQLQDTELRYMDQAYNSFLATAILYEISHQQVKKTEVVEEIEKDLVEQVSEYVVEHFHDNIHGGEIASFFGYNEKYFLTVFRKKSGVSLKQFIDAKKMERAMYLLLNTDAWVVEIAETLGYENVQNFYHIFKKHANCTPTEYRTIYAKKNEYNI